MDCRMFKMDTLLYLYIHFGSFDNFVYFIDLLMCHPASCLVYTSIHLFMHPSYIFLFVINMLISLSLQSLYIYHLLLLIYYLFNLYLIAMNHLSSNFLFFISYYLSDIFKISVYLPIYHLFIYQLYVYNLLIYSSVCLASIYASFI